MLSLQKSTLSCFVLTNHTIMNTLLIQNWTLKNIQSLQNNQMTISQVTYTQTECTLQLLVHMSRWQLEATATYYVKPNNHWLYLSSEKECSCEDSCTDTVDLLLSDFDDPWEVFSGVSITETSFSSLDPVASSTRLYFVCNAPMFWYRDKYTTYYMKRDILVVSTTKK